MSRYAEIVPADEIEYSGGVAQIDAADATRYEPLRRIALPYGANTPDWTDKVVLTYTDGSKETVVGHVVTTGEVSDG
jgi:hypothetical protein